MSVHYVHFFHTELSALQPVAAGMKQGGQGQVHSEFVRCEYNHDFKLAFSLAMLRKGMDIFALAKLMGHEGISVLQGYLKQTDVDTEEAHHRADPVDTAGL